MFILGRLVTKTVFFPSVKQKGAREEYNRNVEHTANTHRCPSTFICFTLVVLLLKC